jgi:hypothetical protein
MAGLLTFKRSEQWCPEHGTTKACLLCERPQPQVSPRALDEDVEACWRH